MRPSNTRLVFGLLLAAALLAPAAFAQESGELRTLSGEQDIPQFERDISVRLRLVDITVVDRSGNYVTDLTADEFVLLVNGREQEIRTFDVFFPGAGRGEAGAGAGAEGGGVPAAVSPSRLIILFFDQAYSSYRGLRNAKAAAEQFVLRSLSPGDRVMVIGYDHSIRIHNDFALDRDEIIAAIQGISYGFGSPSLSSPAQFRGENQFDIRVYLQALNRLALYLKAFRGRKTMVMLSEGFDYRIAIYSIPQYLRETLEAFNDASTSIFSVDVGGLQVPGSGGAPVRYEISRRQGRHDTLANFAGETGGKFYRGSNNIESLLLSIDSDVSHYYVLGFHSDEEPNGRFREVEVRTTRPGVRLYHRRGHFAPKLFERLNRDERAVHLQEGFNRNSPFAEFEARFRAHIFPRADGSAVASLVVEAPLGEGNSPEMELLGYVYNREYEIIDVFHKRFDFARRPDGETFRHAQTVALEPGDNLIKVVLRDNRSGQRAYSFLLARMPELGEGLHAGTIAIGEPAADFVDSSRARVSSLEGQYGLPHQELADPLAPLTRVGILAVASFEPEANGRVGVIIRVAGLDEGDATPRLATSYTLRGEDGSQYRPAELELRIYRVAGTRAAIVHSVLDLAGVPPGAYLLRARVDDADRDRAVGQQTRITIR